MRVDNIYITVGHEERKVFKNEIVTKITKG